MSTPRPLSSFSQLSNSETAVPPAKDDKDPIVKLADSVEKLQEQVQSLVTCVREMKEMQAAQAREQGAQDIKDDEEQTLKRMQDITAVSVFLGSVAASLLTLGRYTKTGRRNKYADDIISVCWITAFILTMISALIAAVYGWLKPAIPKISGTPSYSTVGDREGYPPTPHSRATRHQRQSSEPMSPRMDGASVSRRISVYSMLTKTVNGMDGLELEFSLLGNYVDVVFYMVYLAIVISILGTLIWVANQFDLGVAIVTILLVFLIPNMLLLLLRLWGPKRPTA